MKTTSDECVDCGLSCMGSRCPNKNVVRYYCDECGEEEILYKYDDRELCIKCIENSLERVY